MIDIKTILEAAIENKASDVHINVGMPPVLRKDTELIDMDCPPVTNQEARAMLQSMVGPEKMKRYDENRDLDFSTSIAGGHRFRVNAHYQRDTVALSFRVIPNQVHTIDDLHLPPIVKELTDLPRGLVLVTGHTGSGKSTSLAAMIGLINSRYSKRIITLEDPVEYNLENEKCMIEQREIGSDCAEFRLGPAPRVASGPGHHHGRRNARLGDDQLHDHGRRNRPHGPEHAAHDQRPAEHRAYRRYLSVRAAEPDPNHAGEHACRR